MAFGAAQVMLGVAWGDTDRQVIAVAALVIGRGGGGDARRSGCRAPSTAPNAGLYVGLPAAAGPMTETAASNCVLLRAVP